MSVCCLLCNRHSFVFKLYFVLWCGVFVVTLSSSLSSSWSNPRSSIFTYSTPTPSLRATSEAIYVTCPSLHITQSSSLRACEAIHVHPSLPIAPQRRLCERLAKQSTLSRPGLPRITRSHSWCSQRRWWFVFCSSLRVATKQSTSTSFNQTPSIISKTLFIYTLFSYKKYFRAGIKVFLKSRSYSQLFIFWWLALLCILLSNF